MGANYHGRRRLAKRTFGLILSIAIIAHPVHSGINTAEAANQKRCPQYEKALKAHGLPPKVFSFVAWRESRCHPSSVSAVRSTGWPDAGLLQIQGSWQTLTAKVCQVSKGRAVVRALATLNCNLKVAAVLWDNGNGASNWGLTHMGETKHGKR